MPEHFQVQASWLPHILRRGSCRPDWGGDGLRCSSQAIFLALADLAPCFKGVQVDALVLERTPQPLDHNIVHPPALTVHGDPDSGSPERPCELKARKLAPWSVLKISGAP